MRDIPISLPSTRWTEAWTSFELLEELLEKESQHASSPVNCPIGCKDFQGVAGDRSRKDIHFTQRRGQGYCHQVGSWQTPAPGRPDQRVVTGKSPTQTMLGWQGRRV